MKVLVIAVLFSIILPVGYAGDRGSGISGLSPELRKLFASEMRQLKLGMMEVMTAYITGQWDKVARIAKQMETSYVLKKNLTKVQMHELHTRLPRQFLMLDKRFHYYSGMLHHVAKTRKVELIGFYIHKMSETCVACHRSYATEKFPSMKLSGDGHEQHH